MSVLQFSREVRCWTESELVAFLELLDDWLLFAAIVPILCKNYVLIIYQKKKIDLLMRLHDASFFIRKLVKTYFLFWIPPKKSVILVTLLRKRDLNCKKSVLRFWSILLNSGLFFHMVSSKIPEKRLKTASEIRTCHP